MRKIITKNNYVEDKGHHPIGVSKTVPRLSLPVSELVKRFTLTTIKEMEEKSLLTYDFGPEVTEDPFKLLDKMDLQVANCIDITDFEQLHQEALRQLNEYKELQAKEKAAQQEARDLKEAEAKNALIEEAKRQILADGSLKID